MLWHSSVSKSLLAFLLPLTLILSWAACISLCQETTARPDQTSTQITTQYNENACGVADEADGCPMGATIAVVQERQAVKMTGLSAAVAPVLPLRASHSAQFASLPEVNQNPPPKLFRAPLYLRLCTFRI